MKKLIILVVGLIFITGCNETKAKIVEPTYRTITGSSAIDFVNDGAILLDVRTKEEYDDQHLPDAVNIPLDQIQDGKIDLGKNKTIIVYCKSGARSKVASQTLLELGFNNVYDLGSINNYQ